MAVSLALLAACGGGEPTIDAADATAPPAPSPSVPRPVTTPPIVDAGAPDVPVLDAAPPRTPCPKLPCADRPIVFVHGFTGSNHDWLPMMGALVANDGRYDGYVLAGRGDHTYPSGSLPRRKYLFAFDYYVEAATDARGSYTAGPGRIGSNASYVCNQPAGKGHILADKADYDLGYTHEYAQDLSNFVDDVIRATGEPKVDIGAHSMGGVISRSFLAFFGGNAKVDRLLLLASPVGGVSLAQLGSIVGLGEPWMGKHEMAELDSGGLLSAIKFERCGFAGVGGWPSHLLAHETTSRIAPQFWVMSGQRDLLVGFGSADHPQAMQHEVVPGVDHPGILKDAMAIAKVRTNLGGIFEP